MCAGYLHLLLHTMSLNIKRYFEINIDLIAILRMSNKLIKLNSLEKIKIAFLFKYWNNIGQWRTLRSEDYYFECRLTEGETKEQNYENV